MINFFKNKRNRVILFPFIFNSAQGIPFRTEIYNINGEEKKIEFFILEQSKYNLYFLDMKQYVVWSILDNLYRVFVYEPYYKEFEILYQKEINIIYMDFLRELLKKRSQIIQKNILYLILNIFIFLFLFFLCWRLNFLSNIFIFVFLFIFLFSSVFFNINIKQKKKFQNYKKELFKQMTEKVKIFLGTEVFDCIVEKQRIYSTTLQLKKE